MGGSHKVPSDSPASRPQELEPQHQLGGTTQIPRGKPRSSREKFTQLTANMEYLYPQPPAGPAPTYLLPVDILGVVRDDGLAGHVIGTTDTARPRPNYSESARKNKTKKNKKRGSIHLRDQGMLQSPSKREPPPAQDSGPTLLTPRGLTRSCSHCGP